VKKLNVEVKKLQRRAGSSKCILSKDIFNDLKLSTDVVYNIHFGQYMKSCLISPGENDGKCIYFPETIFEQLMFYSGINLNIWRKGNEIFLGPVVGIFETPYFIQNIIKGKITFYESQNIKASIAENCLGYYFSINDINWSEKKIRGITFIPFLNKWRYRWFPMPDVLYDEGVFLSDDVKPIAKQIRKQFRGDPSIKFINNRSGLGKWELCEKLFKYPEMKKYIPETRVYTSFSDVIAMLNKYNTIFIKSIHGSLGHEVLSIEKNNNKYKLNFYQYKLKRIIIKDIKKLEKFIDNYTKERKFIVQQGIKLLKFKGQNMDLRIFLQKNGKGQWISTYNLCRIARGNATITNYCTGGEMAIYEQIYPLLNSILCKKGIPSVDEVVNTTIKIATYIEREFGLFGEIGVDIGIDEYGDIWIIEANAKPDKIIAPDNKDLFGNSLSKVLNEVNFINGKKTSSLFGNFEGIVPEVLEVFRYSKYLTINS
jgi:hypothetical protein